MVEDNNYWLLKYNEDKKKINAKQMDISASEVRKKLITSNLGLVRLALKLFCVNSKDYEDLFQTGAVGLIKAVDAFNVGENTNNAFSTFAVPCIINEIRSKMKKNGKIASKEISLNEKRKLKNNDEQKTLSVEDVLESDDNSMLDMLVDKQEVEQLKIFLECLPENQKEVLLLKYVKNMNVVDISRELNIARTYVSALNIIALENIKSMFDSTNDEELALAINKATTRNKIQEFINIKSKLTKLGEKGNKDILNGKFMNYTYDEIINALIGYNLKNNAKLKTASIKDEDIKVKFPYGLITSISQAVNEKAKEL